MAQRKAKNRSKKQKIIQACYDHDFDRLEKCATSDYLKNAVAHEQDMVKAAIKADWEEGVRYFVNNHQSRTFSPDQYIKIALNNENYNAVCALAPAVYNVTSNLKKALKQNNKKAIQALLPHDSIRFDLHDADFKNSISKMLANSSDDLKRVFFDTGFFADADYKTFGKITIKILDDVISNEKSKAIEMLDILSQSEKNRLAQYVKQHNEFYKLLKNKLTSQKLLSRLADFAIKNNLFKNNYELGAKFMKAKANADILDGILSHLSSQFDSDGGKINLSRKMINSSKHYTKSGSYYDLYDKVISWYSDNDTPDVREIIRTISKYGKKFSAGTAANTIKTAIEKSNIQALTYCIKKSSNAKYENNRFTKDDIDDLTVFAFSNGEVEQFFWLVETYKNQNDNDDLNVDITDMYGSDLRKMLEQFDQYDEQLFNYIFKQIDSSSRLKFGRRLIKNDLDNQLQILCRHIEQQNVYNKLFAKSISKTKPTFYNILEEYADKEQTFVKHFIKKEKYIDPGECAFYISRFSPDLKKIGGEVLAALVKKDTSMARTRKMIMIFKEEADLPVKEYGASAYKIAYDNNDDELLEYLDKKGAPKNKVAVEKI